MKEKKNKKEIAEHKTEGERERERGSGEKKTRESILWPLECNDDHCTNFLNLL